MSQSAVVAETGDGRRAPRTNLFLAATLDAGGTSCPVRIRNLSTNGAQVEGACLPAMGSEVALQRTAIRMTGIVRWATTTRAGIEFDGVVDPAAWVTSVSLTSRTQSDVDSAIAAIRAGLTRVEPPPKPVKPSPPLAANSLANVAPDVVNCRVSEEISCVARMVESASEALAKNGLVAARHAEQLQELDMAAQLLVQLAGLVASEDLPAAIAGLTLSDLRRRLTRTSL